MTIFAVRFASSLPGKPELASTSEDNLETIAEDLGENAAYQVVDVTSREQVQSFVDAAVRTFGRVDVVVNNAGLMPLSPLEALQVDRWEQVVDVDIKAVLYGITAVLPVMQKQRDGQFVNLSSVAGHVVFPNSAVYSGLKYAVRDHRGPADGGGPGHPGDDHLTRRRRHRADLAAL